VPLSPQNARSTGAQAPSDPSPHRSADRQTENGAHVLDAGSHTRPASQRRVRPSHASPAPGEPASDDESAPPPSATLAWLCPHAASAASGTVGPIGRTVSIDDDMVARRAARGVTGTRRICPRRTLLIR
jgi:hypothetical protein